MKYNLKNRPDKHQSSDSYWMNCQEWFEGFTKELKQMISQGFEIGKYAHHWRTIQMGKEILGDKDAELIK